MSNQAEVLLLKLTSGEEIIGKVLELDGNSSQVESPLIITLRPDREGNVSVNFTPFLPLAVNDTILLMRSHVVGIAVPTTDAIKNYSAMIGDTVVVVPEKKIILS